MRKTLLVVGEDNWPSSGDIICLTLEDLASKNVRATSDVLQVRDNDRWVDISGVIWRCQFDGELGTELALLNMIRLSSVPCTNQPESMILHGARIAGYSFLSSAGYPVVAAEIYLSAKNIGYVCSPKFPAVLKVGNWQMGYGKSKASAEEEWLNVVDMVAISRDFVCIEPFIDYRRDFRCLYTFGKITGIERIGSQWKSNVDPLELKFVALPPEISESTTEIAKELDLDVVGIDWVQDKHGDWTILEMNLSPGLYWPDLFDLREFVSQSLRSAMAD